MNYIETNQDLILIIARASKFYKYFNSNWLKSKLIFVDKLL